MHGILKRLASLYVLTNKHMSTPEETICHLPVARVAWPVCSAESHRNWQRRHESLLPPWHTRDIRRQDYRKWSLIGHLELTWRCVCSFFVFCRKNLLRTRNIVMLIMPQWFRCQLVKTECPRTQASVSYGVSCLWNHILASEAARQKWLF